MALSDVPAAVPPVSPSSSRDTNGDLRTPVVLIVFNRPALTEQVFAAIARARPRQLFVVADGPRAPQDRAACERAREVATQVSWPCELRTNFSDVNLGAGGRPATGLDWVFSQVESAIILEDDCVPSPDFFRFCTAMLDRYRDDERVMDIGGSNLLSGQHGGEGSYYFSHHVGVWGWATWRRAWRHYDHALSAWPKLRSADFLRSTCTTSRERRYWTRTFDGLRETERNDIWDVRWMFAMWTQHGLSVTPKANLVTNIGFGEDATHTRDASHPVAGLSHQALGEIRHPPHMVRDIDADLLLFDRVVARESGLSSLPGRVWRRLRRA